MGKALLGIIIILFVSCIVLTGCMRTSEICDYDGVCSETETDNCVDCEDVIGRGLEVPQKTTSADSGNFVP